MATDPVCFAFVDEEKARFKSTFRDTDYYFCTNHCRKQFDEDPKKYTRIPSEISIEPGEVEQVLHEHPMLAEAAVVAYSA